ncbi:hypothetical protein BOTBODRAFT_28856 [Botryobasidium botryosum FD-172 SS1]|uniref:HNH nuclease domain-containing protein n=1 Tax=Botryobasidium botryosum (strain FD-172 SS1) TaxID=930990 RepID=A0A067N3Z2_BOTB1|nr:hypothetical protein BOTBODRAFT_28856 [Botryobasidium botryosum FD-172 SS1]
MPSTPIASSSSVFQTKSVAHGPLYISRPRNIRIYDSRGVEVAGVEQPIDGVWTGKRLYRALTLCFVPLPVQWWLSRRDSGERLMNNDVPVEQGYYDVMSADGPLQIQNTSTPFFERALTPMATPRASSFITPLRSRDGKCVITGRSPHAEDWASIKACHIVPLMQPDLFEEKFAPLLANDTLPEDQPLNSVQNGLILASEFREHWNRYNFSIDPDDGYRIVWFSGAIGSVAPHPQHAPGLQRTDIPGELRALDEALRWHYMQAVLGNIRGVGDRRNDSWIEGLGLDPGYFDLSRQDWSHPKHREILESELRVRLYDVRHRRNAPMYVEGS